MSQRIAMFVIGVVLMLISGASAAWWGITGWRYFVIAGLCAVAGVFIGAALK